MSENLPLFDQNIEKEPAKAPENEALSPIKEVENKEPQFGDERIRWDGKRVRFAKSLITGGGVWEAVDEEQIKHDLEEKHEQANREEDRDPFTGRRND